MKKCKQILTVVLCCLMMLTCAVPALAATAPAAPKNLKVNAGSYYKYWDAHRKSLTKAGYVQADGYDAIISWSKASKATGYKVTIYWDTEGEKSTTKVYVKKTGSKYVFSTKGNAYGEHKIAKDEKSFITKGSKNKFTSSKLSFQVCGNGSCVKIYKVSIKSYRLVKGKKVYSKAVSKKL